MIATFVALTVVGVVALTQIFGSGRPEPTVPTAATPTTTTTPTKPAPTAITSTATGTVTPTPSPTNTPAATVPATARRCSTQGSDAVATAHSGNTDTSCAFSNAVRAAYREAGSPGAGAPFRAYSPVTKRWYDVTCQGTGPLRCASADGAAVVFLAP